MMVPNLKPELYPADLGSSQKDYFHEYSIGGAYRRGILD
jgi:hypothetical protein